MSQLWKGESHDDVVTSLFPYPSGVWTVLLAAPLLLLWSPSGHPWRGLMSDSLVWGWIVLFSSCRFFFFYPTVLRDACVRMGLEITGSLYRRIRVSVT